MTRFFTMAFMAVLTIVMSASFISAQAADEFSPRFTNQAPAALQDSEADALMAVQDSDVTSDITGAVLNEIAPASGNDPTDEKAEKAEEPGSAPVIDDDKGNIDR